jgi:hypothetical protein
MCERRLLGATVATRPCPDFLIYPGARQAGRRPPTRRRRTVSANPREMSEHVPPRTRRAGALIEEDGCDSPPRGPHEAEIPSIRRGSGCEAGAGSRAPTMHAPFLGWCRRRRTRPVHRYFGNWYRAPPHDGAAGAPESGDQSPYVAHAPAAAHDAHDPGHDTDDAAAREPAALASPSPEATAAVELSQPSSGRTGLAGRVNAFRLRWPRRHAGPARLG